MHENYTPLQITAIREAIRKGREALMRGGGDPRLFASAFIRAGGLQQPGAELDRESRRRMEIHIMANLNGRHTEAGEAPGIRATIRRELARILGEVERFRAMKHPHLIGFRLRIDKRSPARTVCERYARLDAFGLGSGVVPPHEVVVLPPWCDSIHWQPLYDQGEGTQAKPAISQSAKTSRGE